jgi:hypothetical protein
LGAARRLSMSKKQGRTALDHAYALSLAKRAGLGISGALNGAIIAFDLSYSGVSFFDAVGTAAALMIFGWTGSFIGVTIASPPAARQGMPHLRRSVHPSEVLSVAGTVAASATAFIAAWLPCVPRANHNSVGDCNRLLVVVWCHAADRGRRVCAQSSRRSDRSDDETCGLSWTNI